MVPVTGSLTSMRSDGKRLPICADAGAPASRDAASAAHTNISFMVSPLVTGWL